MNCTDTDSASVGRSTDSLSDEFVDCIDDDLSLENSTSPIANLNELADKTTTMTVEEDEQGEGGGGGEAARRRKTNDHDEDTNSDEGIDDENGNDDESAVCKEFEDYLNDEENYLSLCSLSAEDTLQHLTDKERLKAAKFKKLERLEYSFENYELFCELAVEPYGFLSKKFRRKAWPLLIMHRNKFYHTNYPHACVDDDDDQDDAANPVNESNDYTQMLIDRSLRKYNRITEDEIEKNNYHHQVTLDVVRTLKRFPPEISDRLRQKLQKQLIDLICKILIKYNNLHYYQGYHDICLTFLLVTGADQSIPLLEHLTLSHLTCFMESTMESTLKLLFNIMPLIDSIIPQVAEHIQKAELGVIFSLSWLITWYSHVMDNLVIILRLYDFFIATHPLMPIYLGAVIVTDESEQILNTACDMASLHTIITKFPSKINDIEQIEECIVKTLDLFKKHPPHTLPEMNEKWLEKCKTIQEQMLLEEQKRRAGEEEEGENEPNNQVRQRRKRKDGKDLMLATRRGVGGNMLYSNRAPPGHFKNRLLVGLTVTMGVAAVAMYALNSNAVKDPQDLISKFYNFLSYKQF